MAADIDTVESAHALTMQRDFDAPPALLFKLWTEPAHLVQWWGPRGFHLASCRRDLRVGGQWRFCMREAGRDLWVGGTYREIRPPRRLAFTFVWDDNEGMGGEETLVTLDFEERQGRTRLHFRQEPFPSPAQRDSHRGGWSDSFDMMAEYLAKLAK